MPSETESDAAKLIGGMIVEIESWERWQHLGTKPPRLPRKYSFQGGLSYSPSFEVWGSVKDPEELRGKRVRIWVSPTGRPLKSGPVALRDLGQLYFEEQDRNWEISVSLLLPSTDAEAATVCLASVWKYIELSTADEDSEGGRITAFGFAAGSESRGDDKG